MHCTPLLRLLIAQCRQVSACQIKSSKREYFLFEKYFLSKYFKREYLKQTSAQSMVVLVPGLQALGRISSASPESKYVDQKSSSVNCVQISICEKWIERIQKAKLSIPSIWFKLNRLFPFYMCWLTTTLTSLLLEPGLFLTWTLRDRSCGSLSRIRLK